jgi:Uma2 family endonuclease
MVQYRTLPAAENLPDTDNRPVDNELQYLLPVLLRTTLAFAWPEREDWLMGVNLGIYYDLDLPAIVPDAFLSFGIERYRAKGLRLSYVLWEEQYIVPQWVLETVIQTCRTQSRSAFECFIQALRATVAPQSQFIPSLVPQPNT